MNNSTTMSNPSFGGTEIREVSIRDACACKEKVTNVFIKGLIVNLFEKLTKTGKPYLEGMIANKDNEISFKIWDTNLSDFVGKCGDLLAEPYPVEMLGDVDVYNGKANFVATRIVVRKEESASDYVKASLYNSEKAMNCIIKKTFSFIKSEPLKALCSKVLERYGTRMLKYPYSASVHSELGGFLAHKYNCVIRLLKDSSLTDGVALPVRKIDKEDGSHYAITTDLEVVLTAIICHSVIILDGMTVNPVTGIVTDDGTYLNKLFGSRAIGTLATIYHMMCEISGGTDICKAYYQVLNCLAAACCGVEASTKEAILFLQTINFELDMWHMSEFTDLTDVEEGVVPVARKDCPVIIGNCSNLVKKSDGFILPEAPNKQAALSEKGA